jgi:uncharacterized protein (UPF0332 family)
LGVSGSSAARSHLRLAEGLTKTANVGDAPSEYDVRNALSRSYYALFHACRGYLWARNVAEANVIGKRHGTLHAEMERRMGKSFGRFLRDAYELRRSSDYEPASSVPPLYVCVDRLKQARRQCYFVLVTAKNLISQAEG